MINPWFTPLRKKLAPQPAARAFDENIERRLRRMTSSKAWTNYLELIDAEVNLLSERLIQASPEETPFIVAEIRGLRSVPEKLTRILRGIEHEQRRVAAAAEQRAADANSGKSAFFASPFWRSTDAERASQVQ